MLEPFHILVWKNTTDSRERNNLLQQIFVIRILSSFLLCYISWNTLLPTYYINTPKLNACTWTHTCTHSNSWKHRWCLFRIAMHIGIKLWEFLPWKIMFWDLKSPLGFTLIHPSTLSRMLILSGLISSCKLGAY